MKTTIQIIVVLIVIICACGNKNPDNYVDEIIEDKDFLLKSFGPYYKIAKAAESIIDHTIIYDPSYFRIKYPLGDVPADRGVCTDVIIRAYRKLNIDLQKLVHEDMSANFSKYPQIWKATKPDRNIDHRRVPNLMRFFERYGTVLPITNNEKDYKPGHIVCWDLGGGMLHIGIVSSIKAKSIRNNQLSKTNRYKIVHNIGGGQINEDCLFNWKIIGHYGYFK